MVTTSVGTTLNATKSISALGALNNVKIFTKLMSVRNWIYGQTALTASQGGNLNIWLQRMNRLGMQIHHMIGQGWGNMARYGKDIINSARNLISMAPGSHDKITAFLNSGKRIHDFMAADHEKYGNFRTLQHFISNLKFEEQFRWGQAVLIHLAKYGTFENFSPDKYGL